ncbi:MAG: glycoside hydrolase family 15 protein, partial [Bdellovibrionales bacterium]|nr:glycoside hydrolase family 15 protein [Bdellovibrionales bacterium]
GESLEAPLESTAEEFLQRTTEYWRGWVRYSTILPFEQRAVIRSCLALKVHQFEDTGGIIAASTTSLPEAPGQGRNWDYRYCWIRDAYYTLSALRSIGQGAELERYAHFIENIAVSGDGRYCPVYSIRGQSDIDERTLDLPGYLGNLPVRVGNQAVEHVQNDVYGEMILTLAPIFFDERFVHLRHRDHEDLLIHLSKLCQRSISKPDAGLWEVRNGWQEHTFTNLLCWAGLERVSRLAAGAFSKHFSFDLGAAKEQAFRAVMGAVRDGSLRNGPGDPSLDASLAMAAILRFPDKELCRSTVENLRDQLALGSSPQERSLFYRYRRADDFGAPKSAFLICSFWISQALALLGEKKEAVSVLEGALAAGNHLGLMAEHFLPEPGRQLGNFPQAYSHVGLINAAFAVSPPWHEVL